VSRAAIFSRHARARRDTPVRLVKKVARYPRRLTLFFRVASNEAEAKRGGVAAFALNLVNGELGLFNCDVMA
jgi:hypothetical protein